MPTALPATILLDSETTWPYDVLNFLERHKDLFLAWECKARDQNLPVNVFVQKYESAVLGLREILDNHFLHGYHCTRLTELEVLWIKANGLQPPNEGVLRNRIQILEEARIIEPHIAERLRKENQAADGNRTGRIWFCFYPPRLAGQRGIESFFRSWGGEALYNSHEDDRVTGPILSSLGTPRLIEAVVPIIDLAVHSWLEDKIIRRFLINRGLQTNECVNFDGRT
jgi:hypothetical protein